MMEKNTEVVCPYFSKEDPVRIKCEGFSDEVTKLTLEFKTKQQRQEYQKSFCRCGCWRGCCIARLIEEKYQERR